MNDALARWERYNEAGQRSLNSGQLQEAEQALQSAVAEAEQLGPESSQLAATLQSLGQLRMLAKEYAAAQEHFERALRMRERTLGREHASLVPTLTALASIHETRGELEPAEELLRRALEINEQQLGAAHPEVATTLNNLAKLLFKRRDFTKADRLLIRLLEIKRALGKEHPEVAAVLASLAKLRQVVGKHDQGEQLWRQALGIREKHFAPNDPLLATTLEQLADCCAAQTGKLAEAMTLRERALAIRERAFGAAHPSVAAARAKLEALQGNPASVPAADILELDPPFLRTSQEIPMPSLPSPPSVPMISATPAEEFPSFGRELRMSPPASLPPVAPPRVVTPPAAPPVEAPRPAAALPPRMDFSALPVVPAAPPALVLSESVAPEPPRPAPKKKPRDEPRPRAERSRPPRQRDHSPAPTPAPRTRDTPRAARSGGSRAAAAFVVLVACSIGAGWMYYQREQLEPAPRPAVRTAPRVRTADERTLDAIERGTVTVQAPSGASAAPDARAAGFVRTDEPLDGLQVPGAQVAVPPAAAPAVDSVVRTVEQATRPRMDSAQKAKIDPRAPVFRTP
jgi:tetratricopeptide (TPR) repeat protein